MATLTLKPGLLVAEAAARLSVNHKTILRAIENGQLDALRVADRLFLIPEDSFERYAQRRGEKK